MISSLLLIAAFNLCYTHLCYMDHNCTAWHIHGPPLTWMSPTLPPSGKEGSIETLPKHIREHGLCSHSDFDDKHSFCLLWCSVSVDSLLKPMYDVCRIHPCPFTGTHSCFSIMRLCSCFAWRSLCLGVPDACSSWLLWLSLLWAFSNLCFGKTHSFSWVSSLGETLFGHKMLGVILHSLWEWWVMN